MPPFLAAELVVVQGARTVWSGVWSQADDDGSNKTPVPLDAYTSALAQIRRDPGAPLILDITPYVAIQPGAVIGLVQIDIPAGVTSDVCQPAQWDVFLIPADPDDTLKFAEGPVTVNDRISVAE